MGITLTSDQTALAASASSYEADIMQAGLMAIPRVFRDSARMQEDLHMLARQFGAVRAVGVNMLARAWVGTASVDASGPDWLDFLANDYGTSRASGETDSALRIRMRTVPRGVVRSELLELAQDIVDAAGVVGTVAMVEMPRDAAYFGSWTPDTGTGGTFLAESGGIRFTPTTGFAVGHPPYWGGESSRVAKSFVTFAGSAESTNDGTFEILGLKDDGVLFANGSEVDDNDATVTWTIDRRTAKNASMTGGKAFFSRGHRMWRGKPIGSTETHGKGIGGIIMILPYGCTASTRLSVLETLRQRASAGVIKRVEYRQIP